MGNSATFLPVTVDISEGYPDLVYGEHDDGNKHAVRVDITLNDPPSYFRVQHTVNVEYGSDIVHYINRIVHRGKRQSGLPTHLYDFCGVDVYYFGFDAIFETPLMVRLRHRRNIDKDEYYVKNEYGNYWIKEPSLTPRNYIHRLDQECSFRHNCLLLYISNYYPYNVSSKGRQIRVRVESDFRDRGNFGYERYMHATGSPFTVFRLRDRENLQYGLSLPLERVSAVHVFMPDCGLRVALLICMESDERGPLWFERIDMNNSWKEATLDAPAGIGDKTGIKKLMDRIAGRLNLQTCKATMNDVIPYGYKSGLIIDISKNLNNVSEYFISGSSGWVHIKSIEPNDTFPYGFVGVKHKSRDFGHFGIKSVFYRDKEITGDLAINPQDVYIMANVYYYLRDTDQNFPLLIELQRWDGAYTYYANTGDLTWKTVSRNVGSRMGYVSFQHELYRAYDLMHPGDEKDRIHRIISILSLIFGFSFGFYECYNLIMKPQRSIIAWLLDWVTHIYHWI
ncbi:hypothetical protein BEWA_046740 [Theileria equi strain WA]|uniref:Uncharacterized protein n=1 Tax=Theileria equi strain WA TaxID=1537102 RepID=L1LAC4_THEEQ|nr:hypothetical protein BEWA_046740 [Theileria equi strain WA]EKX72210.1 hypothetical protein BEWA_046740 [Theileria equi strain WA]|eukprot:XP_004831662.1 hypothetical protein BEWA_046740 [Theileria equi strain WA]